jgi:TRAP-type mannitol/chloroaromatic compound transport system permease small subunit
MGFWQRVERVIDVSTEVVGWIGWLLIIYCMAFGFAGVVMRYVFNAPSLWIGTTIQAAMVLMACVGGPYGLKHGQFVKLDLFYAALTPRKKAILDIITVWYTLLILGIFIWKGVIEAHHSIMFHQVTPTAVPIPIYPIKAVIPISAFFVLLIVLQQLMHDIRLIMGKEQDKWL